MAALAPYICYRGISLTSSAGADDSDESAEINIAIVGETKSGKSRFINAVMRYVRVHNNL
jgi:GTP-binding protein EngB required for normal cell division